MTYVYIVKAQLWDGKMVNLLSYTEKEDAETWVKELIRKDVGVIYPPKYYIDEVGLI